MTEKNNNRCVSFLRENLLLVLILVAILCGFGVGLLLKNNNQNQTDDLVLWLTLPGKLFIRSLELLIVPVIFIGVVAATSSLSARSNLRITLTCVGLCLLTHVLACVVAVLASLLLTSLSSDDLSNLENDGQLSDAKQRTSYDIVADILRALIPKNIVKAVTNQELTQYSLQTETEKQNGTSTGTYVRSVEYIDGTNILGVLAFAILIGISTSVLRDSNEKVRLVADLFRGANDVVIRILRWLILLAPVGVASLIVDAIVDVDDLSESFKQIGLFTALCVSAELIYGLVCLSLMLLVFVRQNPFKYFFYFLEPALLAFASTSGAVCIQKSQAVCEGDRLRMDQRMSRFGVPFFTTLQADGSAIFIVMASVFLANFNGFELAASDYVVIVLMSVVLCLCLPSVPSSSIITILVILNAVNLTSVNFSILYTVEWLLDRVRTAVNMYSHCFCTVIANELCKKNLETLEEVEVTGDILSDLEKKSCDFEMATELGQSSKKKALITEQTVF